MIKHSEMGYIIRIARCFGLYRKNHFPEDDLSPSQLMFISQICRHPGASQDDLSDSMSLDKTTISRHVAKLESLGYLTRETSPRDARVKEIYPTQKSLDMYPALRESFHDFYVGLVGDLNSEERDFLSQSLEKMYLRAVEMSQERSSL